MVSYTSILLLGISFQQVNLTLTTIKHNILVWTQILLN